LIGASDASAWCQKRTLEPYSITSPASANINVGGTENDPA
jgi:hypothetical protein